jgi:hypothetical protein
MLIFRFDLETKTWDLIAMDPKSPVSWLFIFFSMKL